MYNIVALLICWLHVYCIRWTQNIANYGTIYTATSPSKKEKLLNSAIEALSKDNDPILLNSFAIAHALYLRADTRLESSNIEGAIADATTASQIAPNEGKVWRVLACANEAGGRIKDAIDALSRMAKVDPSYATKARKEIERLRGL